MPGETPGIFKDWHIRKELHAGHIITTAAMVIAAVIAWANMQSQVQSHSEKIAELEARAARVEVDAGATSRLLERLDERSAAQSAQLARIERRLERGEPRE